MSAFRISFPSRNEFAIEIGDAQLTATMGVLTEAISTPTVATLEIESDQFQAHTGLLLTSQALVKINGVQKAIGHVISAERRRGMVRLQFHGLMSELEHIRLTGTFAGFPPLELLYLLLRSVGWEPDKIGGLPKDDEWRWFDCLFQLEEIDVKADVHLGGSRVYRLTGHADTRDRHEKALLASDAGRGLRGRSVVRVQVLANEWVVALERAREQALHVLEWLDLTNSLPMATTSKGVSLLPWRRTDLEQRPRLGQWYSLFDAKAARLWIGRPFGRRARRLTIGRRVQDRLGWLDYARPGIQGRSQLRESARWLYAARRAVTRSDQVLAAWYALEFAVGSEEVEPAFTAEEKGEVGQAILGLAGLSQRQKAVLRGAIDGLNNATFNSRLNAALSRLAMQLTPQEKAAVKNARTFRNSLLHGGGRATIADEEINTFEGAVRKLVLGLAESDVTESRVWPFRHAADADLSASDITVRGVAESLRMVVLNSA